MSEAVEVGRREWEVAQVGGERGGGDVRTAVVKWVSLVREGGGSGEFCDDCVLEEAMEMRNLRETQDNIT